MQGSILNNIYQIETQLSKRGSRATWLAKNLNTNEAVVVKILKFGFDAEWSDFRLFEREAQTLKNIDHPAIPNYLDYFELDLPNCKGFPNGYRYAYALVQEYIAAPSLEAAVKSGRTFSELEIKEIATALLNILLYLHQQQPSIIHRDIKPSNVLLTDRSGNSVGQVYLIDFGAVKSAATESGTITVVGTYGYMPPEQFGGHTTPASDLYSFGATLIYLATGRHPTELPSKKGKIAFTDSVRLHSSFIKWIERLIEPDLDIRYASATAALQGLKYPLAKADKERIYKQPKFSRFKLHKTQEAIDVVVPPQGFTPEVVFLTFFALFWNGFMAVWTGLGTVGGTPLGIGIIMLLFSIPFWLIGLSLIGSIFFILFGKTKLHIDSEHISMTHECLGIKFQKPKATERQDINAIECTRTGWYMERDGEKTEVSVAVIIWANGKAYTLNPSVRQQSTLSDKITHHHPTSIELNWLAQELSQWLDLPITYRETKHS